MRLDCANTIRLEVVIIQMTNGFFLKSRLPEVPSI
jgi:hypothetical protein